MKKFFICLLCALVLGGCQQQETITYSQPEGETADMSGYGGLETEQFISINSYDALALLGDESITTIVYIGYDSCPWCNALVPVLNEVSIEKDMKVYYLDFMAESENNAEQLWEFVDAIGAYGYLSLDDNGDYAISMPAVVYIQKGEVVNYHEGTVSGHDASTEELSEKQEARLTYQLEKEFDSLFEN